MAAASYFCRRHPLHRQARHLLWELLQTLRGSLCMTAIPGRGTGASLCQDIGTSNSEVVRVMLTLQSAVHTSAQVPWQQPSCTGTLAAALKQSLQCGVCLARRNDMTPMHLCSNQLRG